MTKLTKQSGFTLIEILISITILSILSALAAPSLASLINHNKTKAASILFQDNLRQARYDSKTNSNSTIVFCAVKASINRKEECVENNSSARFSNGWQWFVDDGNFQYDPASDTLLGNTFEADTNDIDVEVLLVNGSSDRILRNRIVFNNGDPTIISAADGNANTNMGTEIQPIINFTDDVGRVSSITFDVTGRSKLAHY